MRDGYIACVVRRNLPPTYPRGLFGRRAKATLFSRRWRIHIHIGQCLTACVSAFKVYYILIQRERGQNRVWCVVCVCVLSNPGAITACILCVGTKKHSSSLLCWYYIWQLLGSRGNVCTWKCRVCDVCIEFMSGDIWGIRYMATQAAQVRTRARVDGRTSGSIERRLV